MQAGDAASARLLCNEVLRRAPRNPDALCLLGITYLMTGQASDAVPPLEQALAARPRHGAALENLGLAHLMLSDYDAAERALRSAVALPGAPASVFMRLGVSLLNQERHIDALKEFQRALALDPRDPDIHINMGQVLALQGDAEAAREQYLAALSVAPDLIEAHEGLAAASFALGRFGEAIRGLREVLRMEPDHRVAAGGLAEALFQVGELAQAEVAAQRAIALDPSAAGPYAVLAEIHSVRGELDLAVAALETGFEHTNAISLLGTLTFGLRRLCAWEKWRTAWLRLAAALDRPTGEVSPFSLLCEPTTAAGQLDFARSWTALQYGAPATAQHARRAATDKHPRIRVGYFSSDFYEHATAYLLAEVLEMHDRSRFEIFAYAYGPDDASPMRERLRHACEHFVDIAHDPDDIAARRILADDLDILVDLKGHTMGARGALLARRLCPIQVSWLGYPGTMGAEYIDFLIADPFVIPPGQESAYSERIVRLPHCYQPNDRKRVIAATPARAAYGLPDKAFVFCCFNQPYKITPEIFACWTGLLREIPGSVLWLLADNQWATDNLIRAAEMHGIDAARLVFAPKLPLAQHLARYRSADLALDTFPYTSHTTASDALWGDCLIVALCGETFAARVSGSILTACNLPELVTYSLDDYAQLARRIASDAPFREGLRALLAVAKTTAPLFDSAGFTAHLEQLLGGLQPGEE